MRFCIGVVMLVLVAFIGCNLVEAGRYDTKITDEKMSDLMIVKQVIINKDVGVVISYHFEKKKKSDEKILFISKPNQDIINLVLKIRKGDAILITIQILEKEVHGESRFFGLLDSDRTLYSSRHGLMLLKTGEAAGLEDCYNCNEFFF